MATIDVKCRFCNQTDDVKKHGTGFGYRQRYRCNSCRKTFQIDYTYRACKPGIKEQIVDLAINNASIRDTARALHISINAFVRALKKLLLGYSKSADMHDKVIGTFIERNYYL